MTSEENPALALFKSSHDEMREVIKLKSNGQLTSSSPMDNGLAREEEDPAVTKFREYIRIETVQPNPDNAGAMKFLARCVEDEIIQKLQAIHEDKPKSNSTNVKLRLRFVVHLTLT